MLLTRSYIRFARGIRKTVDNRDSRKSLFSPSFLSQYAGCKAINAKSMIDVVYGGHNIVAVTRGKLKASTVRVNIIASFARL